MDGTCIMVAAAATPAAITEAAAAAADAAEAAMDAATELAFTAAIGMGAIIAPILEDGMPMAGRMGRWERCWFMAYDAASGMCGGRCVGRYVGGRGSIDAMGGLN